MRKHKARSFTGRADKILNDRTSVTIHLHLPAPHDDDSRRATAIVVKAWENSEVVECPCYLYEQVKRLLPQAFVKEFIGEKRKTLIIRNPDGEVHSGIWARFA